MKGGAVAAAVVVGVAGWFAGCARRPLQAGVGGAPVGADAGSGPGGAGAAGGLGAGGGGAIGGGPLGCLPSSMVLSCGPAPIDAARVKSFALGATDSEVAVALIQENDQGDTWLSFSRLSPHLELVGSVALDDTRQPGPVLRGALVGTAVASLPSGWVVAVCGLPHIFIAALDPTGAPTGRTVVAQASESSGACISGIPVLAAQPGGGALLSWETSDGIAISMIAADGLSASAPQFIIDATGFADIPAAAWIGDAFYVVAAVGASTGGNARALRIVRVAPDGTATTVGDILAGEARDAPGIAVGADDLRVGFKGIRPGGTASTDSGVFWQQLALTGDALTPVVMLGASTDYWGRPAAIAFGGDTVILIGGPTGRLGLIRVASDGEIVTPVSSFLAAPSTPVGTYDLVRIGAEVVAGWTPPYGTGRLGLARLTP
jgi:hypothetical protein